MDTPGRDELGWWLTVVFRAHLKAVQAATVDLPGGPRCYEVLAVVADNERGNQSMLAHRLGMDRTVLTYLLDDMVAAGLVERRPDPADRRSRLVVPTAAGRRLLTQLDDRLAQAEEELLVGLSTTEQEALRTLLQRVAARAESRDPVAERCEAIDDIAARSAGTAGSQEM